MICGILQLKTLHQLPLTSLFKLPFTSLSKMFWSEETDVTHYIFCSNCSTKIVLYKLYYISFKKDTQDCLLSRVKLIPHKSKKILYLDRYTQQHSCHSQSHFFPSILHLYNKFHFLKHLGMHILHLEK